MQNCLSAQSLLSKLGIEVTVADARFCKPLDIQLVRKLCDNHSFLITVEEGTVGGFGSHVAQFLTLDGQLDGKIKVMIGNDCFDYNSRMKIGHNFGIIYSFVLKLYVFFWFRSFTIKTKYFDPLTFKISDLHPSVQI